jgi:hypothetical protein
LVKEALARNTTIGEVALEKTESGELQHVADNRPIKPEEVKSALRDLRRLTEGGIIS